MQQVVKDWDDLDIFRAAGMRIGESYVRITKSSTFLFSSGFMHEAKLKDISHVVLGYSIKKKAIIFQFTSDAKAPGAHKVVQRSNNGSCGSRSFFNYYFLKPQELEGRYIPKNEKVPKIGNIWVIYLDQKQTILS